MQRPRWNESGLQRTKRGSRSFSAVKKKNDRSVIKLMPRRMLSGKQLLRRPRRPRLRLRPFDHSQTVLPITIYNRTRLLRYSEGMVHLDLNPA
jgi:hypothetical protein